MDTKKPINKKEEEMDTKKRLTRRHFNDFSRIHDANAIGQPGVLASTEKSKSFELVPVPPPTISG